MNQDALMLSPPAVAAGMVFVFKADSPQRFTSQRLECSLTAAIMPLVPQVAQLLMGVATATAFPYQA